MQFGINKRKYIFQRLPVTKLHEPIERVQFGVFEKFTSACLFQIAREKLLCDYLLIIYMKKCKTVKKKRQEKIEP